MARRATAPAASTATGRPAAAGSGAGRLAHLLQREASGVAEFSADGGVTLGALEKELVDGGGGLRRRLRGGNGFQEGHLLGKLLAHGTNKCGSVIAAAGRPAALFACGVGINGLKSSSEIGNRGDSGPNGVGIVKHVRPISVGPIRSGLGARGTRRHSGAPVGVHAIVVYRFLSTLLTQEFGNVIATTAFCGGQWCVSLAICSVDIGALGDKQFDEGFLPRFCGHN